MLSLRRIYKILLLCMLFFIILSCKDDERYHEKMYFDNTSNSPVYIEWSSSVLSCLLSERAKNHWYDHVYPKKSIVLYNFDTWESFFLHSSDTMRIYIADAEKVNVDDTTNLLVRYDLSLYDLQELNWHLTYPPSIDMKDMTMTPSFDSLFVSQ